MPVTLFELGNIHRKSQRWRNAKERAIRFAMEAFGVCQNPYLSISGGKDSIAMLAIVEQAAQFLGRDYCLWAHLSDASFPGTQEIIEQCAALVGRKLILDFSPVSAFTVLREKVIAFGKTGYFFDAIRAHEESRSHDLKFVGVRAAESKRRKKACDIHGPLFYSSVTAKDMLVSYPLIYFSVEDVCAAIVEANLPFHPIYSCRHPSADARNIRLGYLTQKDLMNKGTVAFIKANYPEIYNKLVFYMPEVSCYV